MSGAGCIGTSPQVTLPSANASIVSYLVFSIIKHDIQNNRTRADVDNDSGQLDQQVVYDFRVPSPNAIIRSIQHWRFNKYPTPSTSAVESFHSTCELRSKKRLQLLTYSECPLQILFRVVSTIFVILAAIFDRRRL